MTRHGSVPRSAERAVPCRAITHSKQNKFRDENIMTMGMEAMIEVEGVSMGK